MYNLVFFYILNALVHVSVIHILVFIIWLFMAADQIQMFIC